MSLASWPKAFEPAAQVMAAATQASMPVEAGREVGKPGFGLAAGERLAQNDGAALVEADEVDGVLADVDAEDGDGVFRLARHGPGFLLGSTPHSTTGYGPEHHRSIP